MGMCVWCLKGSFLILDKDFSSAGMDIMILSNFIFSIHIKFFILDQ